ncbi:CLC_0170 family protein [uncultured Paenibacillus sp.]|uniref:CLC_0170 family protein n=1 Tax=uncultured Paenibacillus sp. TaxID=227322 RepID=UPI0015ABBBDD|nr:CLC_0170 family protein [uncultured Paenibacillus sp.]
MYRALAFTSALLLFSGLILLLVDNKIYTVQQMVKEQKYAKISGWIQLILSGIGFLTSLLLQL